MQSFLMAIEDPSKEYHDRPQGDITPRPSPPHSNTTNKGHTEFTEKDVAAADPFKANFGFHDPVFSLPPPHPISLGTQVQALEEPLIRGRNFIPGNGHKSNMSNPDPSRTAPDSNRAFGVPHRSNQRRQQQAPNVRRSTVNQTPLPAPPGFYPPSSPQENVHPATSRAYAIPPSYQGGPPQPYQTAPSPYNQRSGFVGPYTQPPIISMAPSPPSYTYPHNFHHGAHGPLDSNVLSQAPHIGFQPVIQHSPVYQYQNASSEGFSNTQPSFVGTPPYNVPIINPSSPPHSPLSPQQSPIAASQHPSLYSGQYHNMRYNTPPAMFSYPSQQYSPSPYPAPYAPSQYSSPYSISSEENMAGWWYIPQAGPLSAYNPSVPMQYPHHYQLNLPGSRLAPHAEVEPHFSEAVHLGPPTPAQPSSAHFVPARRASTDVAYPSVDSVQSSSSQVNPSPPASSKGDPSVTSAPRQNERERPLHRRRYHPSPPVHRSAWVMWAGNVPADTTHDEFWRFLHSHVPLPPSSSGVAQSSSDKESGVTSIFLIARSNCAFVNYSSEEHLHTSIARNNGVPIRPHDARCPRLVCRVRRPDDDLRAGVGGQRGIGMHTRWVKEQARREKEKEEEKEGASRSSVSEGHTSGVSVSSSKDPVDDTVVGPLASLSLSSDEEGDHTRPKLTRTKLKTKSSSGSYASTNSSILAQYFPKRYFILKSLTQSDLETSVQQGLWATQKHNEGILDQAFRTSEDIYLIFSVNKSGEFYGYAKMVSPILQGEHRVSWAGRTDSSRSSAEAEIRSPSYQASPSPLYPYEIPSMLASKRANSIEAPQVEVTHTGRTPVSAPADLGAPRIHISTTETRAKIGMLGPRQSPADEFPFPSERSAPIRPLRDRKGTDDSPLQSVKEENVNGDEEESEVEVVHAKEATSWGEPFKVEWLCTERLPFYRTRHVRNPWNHDREVKVSRDGTELEPGVGQRLLDEWHILARVTAEADQTHDGTGGGRRKSIPGIATAEAPN